jgi:hypothetical protein
VPARGHAGSGRLSDRGASPGRTFRERRDELPDRPRDRGAGASEAPGVRRAAVEAALARWDFHPGFIDTVKDGLDLDGDGKADYTILLRHEEVPVTYDVGFEFRIVDGEGVVAPGVSVP